MLFAAAGPVLVNTTGHTLAFKGPVFRASPAVSVVCGGLKLATMNRSLLSTWSAHGAAPVQAPLQKPKVYDPIGVAVNVGDETASTMPVHTVPQTPLVSPVIVPAPSGVTRTVILAPK